MNKKELINELAWKNFRQQKIREIIIFILIIGIIIMTPYTVGSLVSHGGYSCYIYSGSNLSNDYTSNVVGGEEYCNEVGGQYHKLDLINIWSLGLLSILAIAILLAMLLFMVWGTYTMFKDWIKSNWRKANERAVNQIKLHSQSHNKKRVADK